jgi:splicing factor 3A subunit 3
LTLISRLDRLRVAEIDVLSVPASSKAPGSNPQDDLSEFYTRFNHIKKVHQDRQAAGTTQEPELRTFLRSLEELVKSDGLERVILEDGEEEVIDRKFRELCHINLNTDQMLILTTVALDTMFTGEESMGRYLDLYIPHTQFVNLKSARRWVSASQEC